MRDITGGSLHRIAQYLERPSGDVRNGSEYTIMTLRFLIQRGFERTLNQRTNGTYRPCPDRRRGQ